MRIRVNFVLIVFCAIFIFSSCESEAEKNQRLVNEEQQKIEMAAQLKKDIEERTYREEQERNEQEVKIERERQEKLVYERYIGNSLTTGATPYSYCFGSNNSCSSYGCSVIKVKTPFNSDIVVTIKKNNKVYRHAFIKASSQFSFELPNGSYQAFFYYGKGWNPEKVMTETDCGILKGGFVANELFSKDDMQTLKEESLIYELILQENGNLETKPSNLDEAF